MQIKGKKVLITGGAVRIGRALCETFAEAGSQVIIHYRRSASQAEELRNMLPGEGHQIVECDLNYPKDTAELLKNCGKVDILINNASVYYLDKDDANAKEQMQVNYFSPLSLMKQFAAQDLEEGCVINFLDQEVGKDSEPKSSYSRSKVALKDATLAMALKEAPEIRVNAIAPGPVLPPVGLNTPGMQKVLKKVPLGKQIPLKDITDACLFLVRNDSLTGQIIYVDGGQHLN
jgi:NAD(P)-dependent dehydrogenase (short-subunit alcohol dehydrogenase family)